MLRITTSLMDLVSHTYIWAIWGLSFIKIIIEFCLIISHVPYVSNKNCDVSLYLSDVKETQHVALPTDLRFLSTLIVASQAQDFQI